MTHARTTGTLSSVFGLGLPELLLIAGLCVLIFGARRLPEIGSGLGKAIKGFKAGVTEPDPIAVTPNKEEVSDREKP